MQLGDRITQDLPGAGHGPIGRLDARPRQLEAARAVRRVGSHEGDVDDIDVAGQLGERRIASRGIGRCHLLGIDAVVARESMASGRCRRRTSDGRRCIGVARIQLCIGHVGTGVDDCDVPVGGAAVARSACVAHCATAGRVHRAAAAHAPNAAGASSASAAGCTSARAAGATSAGAADAIRDDPALVCRDGRYRWCHHRLHGRRRFLRHDRSRRPSRCLAAPRRSSRRRTRDPSAKEKRSKKRGSLAGASFKSWAKVDARRRWARNCSKCPSRREAATCGEGSDWIARIHAISADPALSPIA